METKPLSKITVSEICLDCGINRKTFYYHFQDVFDLLRWMLDEEALDVVKKADLLSDYEAVLHFIIDYVDKNKHFLTCVYDALGREGMKRFLTSDLRYVAGLLISEVENKLGKFVDTRFRDFLCDFYTNALTGILIDWFHNRTTLDREEIMNYLILTIKSSLPNVIEERAKCL
ncbi:MAG: TetR/AcrR family transcriptional regulator C-terminal domain-containing protein [Lachnospiraceae bacterium]|nr:TetR/AcrR family transcriptional regulator C-terminal domain-containing protein [Lachnospiraceae bacterium]